MEGVDARSAHEMGAHMTHVLGFSDLMFAVDAPRADDDAFEHTLRNVIRNRKKQNADQTRRPHAGKSILSDRSRAVAVHFLRRSNEDGVRFDPARSGGDTGRIGSAATVDSGAKPLQVSPGELSQVRTLQLSGMITESPEVTSLPAAGTTEHNQSASLQETLSTGISWRATVQEAVDMLQQYQASRFDELALEPAIADTPEVGEAVTAGFLREIVQRNRIRTLDLSMPDGVKADLSGGWTAFKGLPRVSADNMIPEPGAGGNGETTAFVKAEMLFPAQDKAFFAENLLSQSAPQEKGTLASFGMHNSPFDGMLQQLMPEQAEMLAAAHMVQVGRGSLVEQLVQGVRVAQNAEATEVFVHLKPDFLGRLSIRVLADDHGMRVEIRVENEVVRQVMQDSLADLQHRLAEKGVTFNQFNILADTGWHSRREAEWFLGEPAIGSTSEPETPAEVAAEQLAYVQSGIIDYLA